MSNVEDDIRKEIKILPKSEYKKIKKPDIPEFNDPIGLFDPFGENVNPLTMKPYTNHYSTETKDIKFGEHKTKIVKLTYTNLAHDWTNFPMYESIGDLIKTIQQNRVTFVKAGTGTGKTVITPKAALQALYFSKKVICTVPKQILARDNASYAAKCLDVELGKEVGYYYMGKNLTSKNTLLTFTTAGSLKSKITNGDAYLYDYDCVILDEAHERTIQTDQLLLLVKEILKKRPEFKLIVMSATINLSDFIKYYSPPFTYGEIVKEAQTNYGVDETFEPKELGPLWKKKCIEKIIDILKNSENDKDGVSSNTGILVFIKSGAEGAQLCEELTRQTEHLYPEHYPFCAVLEGKVKGNEQDVILSPDKYMSYNPENKKHPETPYNRKIVFSTNVAESSLTVDGVKYVIDNGYALVSAHFPLVNARSLMDERISKSSAIQRKGRVGRTSHGYCHKLYTIKEYEKFPISQVPDIQKSDLTKDILDMFNLNYIKSVYDVRVLLNKLISPPTSDFIESALNKLFFTGALSLEDQKSLEIKKFDINTPRKINFDINVEKKPMLNSGKHKNILNKDNINFLNERMDNFINKKPINLNKISPIKRRNRSKSLSKKRKGKKETDKLATYKEIKTILADDKEAKKALKEIIPPELKGGGLINIRLLLEELEKKNNKKKPDNEKNKIVKINLRNEGKITDIGKALAQFRVLESTEAKSILASHYYNCRDDVIIIITILRRIDNRMETIFEKYKPRPNKTPEEQKREQTELYFRQKRFFSKYGDLITILNIYKELKYYMGNEEYLLKNGQKPNARKWCKDNGISPRAFVGSKSDKSWDVNKDDARKYRDLLISIVQPYELKIKYYDEYKANGGKDSLEFLKKKSEINKIVDAEADISEIANDEDPEVAAAEELHGGAYGFKGLKPKYEINLFPNAQDMGSKELNILTSLLIGNLYNVAVLTDEKKRIYKTIFPIKKVSCILDQNTTINKKHTPKYVIFSEIFTMSKDQKIMKLNVVSDITELEYILPDEVLNYK